MRSENSTRDVKISGGKVGGIRQWLASLKARLSPGAGGDHSRCRYTEVLRLDIVALNGTPPSIYGWHRDRILDPIRRWSTRSFSAGAHPADEPGPLTLRPVGRSGASSRDERARWHAA